MTCISAAPGERSARRPCWPLIAGVLAVAAAFLLSAGVAHAKQMTVVSCHTPSGSPVGHAGWSIVRTAQMDMTAQDTCTGGGGGALSLGLAPNGAGYPNGARIEWTFNAPSWATIGKYTVHVAGSYARPGGTPVGAGQVFVDASDESDPIYDFRNLGGGNEGPITIERTPPAPVGWVTIDASCDGQAGPCPANVVVSTITVPSTSIVLDDSAIPKVSELSGTLTPGATLRGQAEASFQASEEGPGIYSAWLAVDGKAEEPVLLDSNNGLCKDLGETSDGTRSFSSPTPCAKSVSGNLTLNTTSLKDGTHTVKLIVDDAAGDQTTAFDGTITTNNAPENTSAPAIVGGQAQVGTSLSSQPGEWAAPEGAGKITYGYQWNACNSTGGACQPIAGATGSTYTPTPGDAGSTLRVTVTATDSDGESSTASLPSAPVQAPSGSLGALPGPGTPSSPLTAPPVAPTPAPAHAKGRPHAIRAVTRPQARAVIHLGIRRKLHRGFAHRALLVRGRLLTRHHHPVAHARLIVLQRIGHGRFKRIGRARTGRRGAFRTHVRPGPSRLIKIAYRGAAKHRFAAVAKLHETVRAGVRLQIRPRRTSRHGTIVLNGRVLGHVPKQGVIVDLLVHYRGKWVPFRTPRTRPSGRFKVAYRFQGARGRFPFRAIVPSSQVDFPFARGRSEVIHVSTR